MRYGRRVRKPAWPIDLTVGLEAEGSDDGPYFGVSRSGNAPLDERLYNTLNTPRTIRSMTEKWVWYKFDRQLQHWDDQAVKLKLAEDDEIADELGRRLADLVSIVDGVISEAQGSPATQPCSDTNSPAC